MEIRTLGIDLGKEVFHIVAQDEQGNIVCRRKFTRLKLLCYTAQLHDCLIGMEACSGSHFLGKKLQDQGHRVRWIPAQFVRAFVKSNKNDYLDAEAIAEAVQRPTMRFVPLKMQEQLDLQALHRVREQWVARRTGLVNQVRAFMLERGITVRKGRLHLQKVLPEILEDAEQKLSSLIRRLLFEQWQELQSLNARIGEVEAELKRTANGSCACVRLQRIPGIATLASTALVAAVGSGTAFKRGRHLAAWMGLVPRQHGTGDKVRLEGISKRGNGYLRRLFIHGARSILFHLKPDDNTRLGRWVRELSARAHHNVVVVALANKLARIAWVVLAQGDVYEPFLAPA